MSRSPAANTMATPRRSPRRCPWRTRRNQRRRPANDERKPRWRADHDTASLDAPSGGTYGSHPSYGNGTPPSGTSSGSGTENNTWNGSSSGSSGTIRRHQTITIAASIMCGGFQQRGRTSREPKLVLRPKATSSVSDEGHDRCPIWEREQFDCWCDLPIVGLPLRAPTARIVRSDVIFTCGVFYDG
jgi:hypothetical protein